jgi:Uma2 family endonuclease
MMEATAAGVHSAPLLLRMRPAIDMTDDEFFEFCQLNRDLRFERTAEGDIVIMAPTGALTGARNIRLAAQVSTWADRDGTGRAFDSSTGFILPNGATRSPDVAWVRRARLAGLTAEQKQKFLPLCPDFVIELRSPSETLSTLQEKMREYTANGTPLGWLIDPAERRVHVYRADGTVEHLHDPAELSGDPVLPGFVLDLVPIWETEL